MSPSEFGKLIAADADKWAQVIRAAGIKMNESTVPALPLPLLQGERVGVRGPSASRARVEAPLTPTLSP